MGLGPRIGKSSFGSIKNHAGPREFAPNVSANDRHAILNVVVIPAMPPLAKEDVREPLYGSGLFAERESGGAKGEQRCVKLAKRIAISGTAIGKELLDLVKRLTRTGDRGSVPIG
jgi:hypothetical protein